MSQMTHDEDTGGGHSVTPFHSEQQVNAQSGPSSLIMSPTDATPEGTVPTINIDVALKSAPDPKQNELPKILPNLYPPCGDILAKEKELQCDEFSPSNLERVVRGVGGVENIIHLINFRVNYLENQARIQVFPHQPKDIEYTRKIVNLIMKHRVSSWNEILSEEKDLVFLRQLLDDILDSRGSSLNAEKVPTPRSLTNSTPDEISPDPVLAALAAAPSCHRRASADELSAPIPYQWR